MHRRDTPVPIARGFATWGTDSGPPERQAPEPRAFALNEESLVNMGLWVIQEDARCPAGAIAAGFYDPRPRRSIITAARKAAAKP